MLVLNIKKGGVRKTTHNKHDVLLIKSTFHIRFSQPADQAFASKPFMAGFKINDELVVNFFLLDGISHASSFLPFFFVSITPSFFFPKTRVYSFGTSDFSTSSLIYATSFLNSILFDSFTSLLIPSNNPLSIHNCRHRVCFFSWVSVSSFNHQVCYRYHNYQQQCIFHQNTNISICSNIH